jgi:serine/threonine protein kinase
VVFCQRPAEVAREVLLHGTEEFTLAEIMAATNNFALDTKISEGGFATVYRGKLPDGREVAIKRSWHPHDLEKEFRREVAILSLLRHNNIVRLIGTTWSMNKEKRLLSFRRRKLEQAEPERLLVYEYMENGALYDQLHREQPSSPVTVSWKLRIDILLGVSRAIEHLHCHATPTVIHRDIKPSNILLDSSWVPRLSDFGASVTWDPMNEDDIHLAVGTLGYFDPEYLRTGRLKPASDVYSLGVLMLEVLTGKQARFNREEDRRKPPLDLACFALPIIQAGNLEELLDKRPAREPRQLQALVFVALTAASCVQLQGKDRPAISEVVASLELVLKFMCCEDTSVLGTRPWMWDYLWLLNKRIPIIDPPESEGVLPETESALALDALESGGALSDTEFTEPR